MAVVAIAAPPPVTTTEATTSALPVVPSAPFQLKSPAMTGSFLSFLFIAPEQPLAGGVGSEPHQGLMEALQIQVRQCRPEARVVA